MYAKTKSGNYIYKNVLIKVLSEAISTGWKKVYVVGGACKIHGQKFQTLKQAIAAISAAKTI